MKLLFLTLLLVCQSLFATEINWHVPYCVNCDQKTFTNSLVPPEILGLASVTEEGAKLKKSIQEQDKKWSNYLTWLKDKKTRKSSEAHADRWKKHLEEAQAILEVHRAIGIMKRKQNTCLGDCGVQRQVEIQVEIQKLEEMKANLTSFAPWWLSEKFDKLAKKSEGNDIYLASIAELRDAMISGLTTYFEESKKISGDIDSIDQKIKKHLEGSKNRATFKLLMGSISIQESDTLDLLLQRGIVSGNGLLCPIANEKSRWDLVKKRGNMTITAGLVAASMLAGPEGFFGLMAARTVGTRAASLVSVLPDAALLGVLIDDRIGIANECKKKLARTKLGDSELEWRKCLERDEAAKLGIIFGGLSSSARYLPKTSNFLFRSAYSDSASKAIKVTETTTGETMTTLNLTQVSSIKKLGLDSVSDRYWSFVANVYSKRLNLTPDEIQGFLKSSKQYEPRTQLILVTKGNPKESPIEGGVALVSSGKKDDLLPLENATGIKLDRKPNEKIAEIARLTSVSEENPKLMIELLQELARTTAKDKTLTKLYVYTSKIHLRLYKKLGIPYKQIGEPIDRDVILEVNAKDFREALSK